jgi:hypothetical protein
VSQFCGRPPFTPPFSPFHPDSFRLHGNYLTKQHSPCYPCRCSPALTRAAPAGSSWNPFLPYFHSFYPQLSSLPHLTLTPFLATLPRFHP